MDARRPQAYRPRRPIPSGRAMVRTKFSKWLAAAVSVAAISSVVWMLDSLVFEFYGSVSVSDALCVVAVWCAVLLLPVRWLALWSCAAGSAHEAAGARDSGAC